MPIKMPVLLVDVEGTLSDSRHRGIYQKDHHIQWHEGFKLDHINSFVQSFIESFQAPYIIVTAKPIEYRALLDYWLAAHITRKPKNIYMRPVGNFDTSPALKEMFLENIMEHYAPVLAMDDRADVCSMYLRNNISAMQVKLPLIEAVNGK